VLVLTRREGETFTLGDDIEIEILDIKPGLVRVGIRAPKSVRVLRSELVDAVAAANAAATVDTAAPKPLLRPKASPVVRG
jgi:carbon storage regulator